MMVIEANGDKGEDALVALRYKTSNPDSPRALAALSPVLKMSPSMFRLFLRKSLVISFFAVCSSETSARPMV
jgi:hypothetical protein